MELLQISLLQSAMDSYYKLRQLFYYKVRHGLLQIATGITKCDTVYYKLRQVLQSEMIITNCDSTVLSCFILNYLNVYCIRELSVYLPLTFVASNVMLN